MGTMPGTGKEGLVFEVGSKVQCQATFDNMQHPAEIIERKNPATEGAPYEYYVHFLDCDRRLDEWVSGSRLSAWALSPGSGTRLEHIPSLASAGDLLTPVGALSDTKITRRLKRKIEELHHVPTAVEEAGDHANEKDHQEKNRVKNIKVVELGKWEMDTWYFAPYPEPYASQEKLYICEFTLKYFKKKKTLLRHLAKLDVRHPPGDEIYRSPQPSANANYLPAAVANPPISVFEVDGKKAKTYCQNLCLLSKLFLDHKTLYYDVDPFMFYVLCERDQYGYHLVGYFSKEKNCLEDYNLACILTLPPYQRKGYGKFLIAFAYELSRREGKIGTPERPLSDLGQVSYRSYWTRVLLDLLKNIRGEVSIREISEMTMIRPDDIISTLQNLGLIKYWKGQHLIHADPKIVQEQLAKYANQSCIEIEPSCLHWQPLQTPTSRKPKF